MNGHILTILEPWTDEAKSGYYIYLGYMAGGGGGGGVGEGQSVENWNGVDGWCNWGSQDKAMDFVLAAGFIWLNFL